MIIPSIDLMGGQTVQLRRGREHVLDAGDPRPIAQKFGMVGEIAVIDLDAAMGQVGGRSNESLIRDLLPLAACRVGGGIRDIDTAIRWLDAGAAKVILGTAAKPEILKDLPRERVIAALDALDGEVVVHGWKTKTGASIADKMQELAPYVGGFLVTFVETEGTMQGLDAKRAESLKKIAGDRQLTVAGGVAQAMEIGALDALGMDAQIGMALYTGRFTLADALAACLESDRPDGLWPTIVADELGVALGLTYSNYESLAAALNERRGIYWSRARGLWRKGDTSGQIQELLSVALDCDRDVLLFTVRQCDADKRPGNFCHLNTRTCFGPDRGLPSLARRLAGPLANGSYTARLFADPALLGAKLIEEAHELTAAQSRDEIMNEAADVLYFTLAKLTAADVSLAEVGKVLDRRALKVTRRPGNAKPMFINPTPAPVSTPPRADTQS